MHCRALVLVVGVAVACGGQATRVGDGGGAGGGGSSAGAAGVACGDATCAAAEVCLYPAYGCLGDPVPDGGVCPARTTRSDAGESCVAEPPAPSCVLLTEGQG